jgi:succinoglycan biosynthesis protein ExoV
LASTTAAEAVKLYFYQHANFGDALNLWLWPRLIPATFDEDPDTLFVGIGTLINDRLPVDPFKVVFGTGVGYYGEPAVVDDRWKVYCVRGPLTARVLKIDERLAVTDAAVLLRLVDVAEEAQQHDFSFMPHWRSAKRWDWKGVCQSNGIHFIDPLGTTEVVLAEIRRTRVLLTEAMHGAIVADAFRVPWVPVVTNKKILEFKWLDWCASLGIVYKPTVVPRPEYRRDFVTSRSRERLGPAQLKSEIASRVALQGVSLSLRTAEALINPILTRRAGDSLSAAAKSCSPTLSSDRAINSATERLGERLESFKADLNRGMFSGVPGRRNDDSGEPGERSC